MFGVLLLDFLSCKTFLDDLSMGNYLDDPDLI